MKNLHNTDPTFSCQHCTPCLCLSLRLPIPQSPARTFDRARWQGVRSRPSGCQHKTTVPRYKLRQPHYFPAKPRSSPIGSRAQRVHPSPFPATPPSSSFFPSPHNHHRPLSNTTTPSHTASLCQFIYKTPQVSATNQHTDPSQILRLNLSLSGRLVYVSYPNTPRVGIHGSNFLSAV